jgi:N-dimethylarginine dimethylaminohydrolase
MFSHAIVRKPGIDFAGGITTSNLGNPDYSSMLRQHTDYTQSLKRLGLHVDILEPLAGFQMPILLRIQLWSCRMWR